MMRWRRCRWTLRIFLSLLLKHRPSQRDADRCTQPHNFDDSSDANRPGDQPISANLRAVPLVFSIRSFGNSGRMSVSVIPSRVEGIAAPSSGRMVGPPSQRSASIGTKVLCEGSTPARLRTARDPSTAVGMTDARFQFGYRRPPLRPLPADLWRDRFLSSRRGFSDGSLRIIFVIAAGASLRSLIRIDSHGLTF